MMGARFRMIIKIYFDLNASIVAAPTATFQATCVAVRAVTRVNSSP
jgi:hypothetical protein